MWSKCQSNSRINNWKEVMEVWSKSDLSINLSYIFSKNNLIFILNKNQKIKQHINNEIYKVNVLKFWVKVKLSLFINKILVFKNIYK